MEELWRYVNEARFQKQQESGVVSDCLFLTSDGQSGLLKVLLLEGSQVAQFTLSRISTHAKTYLRNAHAERNVGA